MSTTRNLLVELFVEELPPKALKRLGDAFATTLHQELKRQGLAGDASAVTSFATPRRLATHVSGVHAIAADQEVDQMNKEMFIALQERMVEDPSVIQRAIHYLSASRHLERIGDHATNIAEDVVFLVEGTVIRHQHEEYAEEE